MPKVYDNNPSTTQPVLSRFLVIFIPFMLILVAAAITHFYTEMKLAQVRQEHNETNNVTLGSQGVVNQMRSVISDLTFLAKLNELLELLDDGEEHLRLKLAQEFLYFSENKAVYDQVSIVDTQGTELIRINYGDGIPYVTPSLSLGNRSGEAYFREAITQGLGGIYMSAFEMESNEGEPEILSRAVIRFGIPLFNSSGTKKGLLFLNIRADRLLWGFKQAARDIVDHAYVLTREGSSLSGPSKTSLDKTSINYLFTQTFPLEWQQIQQKDQGNFSTKNGLFTFDTVYPLVSVLEFYGITGGELTSVYSNKDKPARYWKIVSHISNDKRVVSYHSFLRQHLLLYAFISLFLLAFSFVLALGSIRRNTKKAQAEYERRLQETLDSIQLVALTLDSQGRVLYCNPPLLEVTGWQKQALIKRNWFDSVVPAQHQGSIKAAFNDVMSGKTPLQTTEYVVTTTDGEERLISWNNIISFGPDGKTMTLTSIGHDITEQRQNEKQLHKLSRAVEQTEESIIITDAHGIMEYVNRGFTETTGYSAAEALGKTCGLLQSGDTAKEVYDALWRTISSGREWRGVFRNKRKDGELYWENTTISPIRDEHGEIAHYLAIKEDVTEHRRLRAKVEERDRELAKAKAMAEMGRMATMIAHDLRNPLSSIKMSLQIFRKRPNEMTEEHTVELSSIGLEQVKYMENILADLLLFSKPDALCVEWIQVHKILDTSLIMSQKEIQKRSAEIVTHYQASLPTIHADATKLIQVLSNLIVNALQATDAGDKQAIIQISTQLVTIEYQPFIEIEIRDNGPGISPKTAEKIFEPFFTTRAKGTGLGLPIVKRILDQHKGSIVLKNNKDGGARALITLPTGPLVIETMMPPSNEYTDY